MTLRFCIPMWCVLALQAVVGAAQEEVYEFTWDEFTRKLSHHPVMRQAELRGQSGAAYMLSARGFFDPVIAGSFTEKQFDDKNYFDIQYGTLRWPTAFAVELRSDFERNQGTYLNPQHTTPAAGLLSAGASLPLLQGLVTDLRRTALRQAKSMENLTAAEQQMMVNQLKLDAYTHYWKWWFAAERMKVNEELLQLADVRLQAVKQKASAGDLAGIDVDEAEMQYGQRLQQYAEATQELMTTRIALSTYLWNSADEDAEPVWLPENARPAIPDAAPFSALTQTPSNWSANKNPFMRILEARITLAEAEFKWTKEQLKPKLNLNYNLLTEPVLGSTEGMVSMSNYKWGFDFSFPILNRQARGRNKLQQLRLAEARADYQWQRQMVNNRVAELQQSAIMLTEQYTIQSQNIQKFERLAEGEREKFENGESTLFMVNQRESAAAEARIKLADIAMKARQTNVQFQFISGTIQ